MKATAAVLIAIFGLLNWAALPGKAQDNETTTASDTTTTTASDTTAAVTTAGGVAEFETTTFDYWSWWYANYMNQESVTYAPYVYDPYSYGYGSGSSSGSAGGSASWYNYNSVDTAYSGSAFDAVAQSVMENSANLTELNDKCDNMILANLGRLKSKSATQPQVPLAIDMKVIIISLNDISDKTGIVTMTTRMDFRWLDRRLTLPPNQLKTCNGQTLLIKTAGNIWFPYFLIQNGANAVFYPDAFEKYPSLLRSDGYISWRMAFTLELACATDPRLFPFDKQLCTLLIQSPFYSAYSLNYTVLKTDRAVVLLTSDLDHPTWSVTKQAVQFTSKVPGARFYVEFDRKYQYYAYTILIPLLAVFLQTAATFVIPANAEEKLSTAVSGLMSYFFIFLLFVQTTPQVSSAEMPLLLIFFVVQLMLALVVVLICSIMGRMVCIELEEEEQMAKERKEMERANILNRFQIPKLSQPRMPRIYSSIFNRSAMPGGRQRSHAMKMKTNGMGAISEGDGDIEMQHLQQRIVTPVQVKAGSPTHPKGMLYNVARRLKKLKIHSEAFNDICLLLYVSFVLCSTLVLSIYVYMTVKNTTFPVDLTPIQTYAVGE